MRFDSSGADPAFPTPRSWEMVSHILEDVSDDISVVYPMLVGCIGQIAASGFRTWTALYPEMPPVKEIFQGKNAEKPNAKELHIALRSAMVAYARRHPEKEEINNSIDYACKLPWTFRGALLHDYSLIPAPAEGAGGTVESTARFCAAPSRTHIRGDERRLSHIHQRVLHLLRSRLAAKA